MSIVLVFDIYSFFMPRPQLPVCFGFTIITIHFTTRLRSRMSLLLLQSRLFSFFIYTENVTSYRCISPVHLYFISCQSKIKLACPIISFCIEQISHNQHWALMNTILNISSTTYVYSLNNRFGPQNWDSYITSHCNINLFLHFQHIPSLIDIVCPCLISCV